jgi:hypothetical protein
MAEKKEYFIIKIEELQSLGKWAAGCAERALSIYERVEPEDSRPREAIGAIRDFSDSGKRTRRLRKLAMEAYKASLETKDKAASAAANSASLAAASAYTHPFRDIIQSKHILGPAAYSALAIELYNAQDPETGEREIELAVDSATREIVELLRAMPSHVVGTKRIDQLFYELDSGIRKKFR